MHDDACNVIRSFFGSPSRMVHASGLHCNAGHRVGIGREGECGTVGRKTGVLAFPQRSTHSNELIARP